MTAEFDPATPNMARVYDYWLDGKDNYPADRTEAQRLLAIYPPLRDLVRENRAFVIQAVSWAARQGIGQFIDLGAGLPASPAVHQAARKVMPSAHACSNAASAASSSTANTAHRCPAVPAFAVPVMMMPPIACQRGYGQANACAANG